MNSIIDSLEEEWDSSHGFFGQLRGGIYSETSFQRTFQLLSSLDLSKCETIERRLVSLLWFTPIFMTWQRERVAEKGGELDKLESAINKVVSLFEAKLGVP